MKRIICLLLSVLIVFSGIFTIDVSADTPILLQMGDLDLKCNSGDIISLKYTYYPEFKNEKIITKVYYENSNTPCCDAEQDFYNTSTLHQDYTVTVNTGDLYLSPGRYTVKTTLMFYTMYEWHEAPRVYTRYFTINNNINNKKSNSSTRKKSHIKVGKFKKLSVKNKKNRKVMLKWNKCKNADRYLVMYANKKSSLFSSNCKIKKTKKNRIVVKKLKKGKRYYFRVVSYRKGNIEHYSKIKSIKIKK